MIAEAAALQVAAPLAHPCPPSVLASEAQLVLSARDGDMRAQSELVRLYRVGVLSQCLRWGLTRADAEDVAQDVLIKALRNLSSYRHENSFSAWLYKITKNSCLDHLRARMRKTARLANDSTGDGDAVLDLPATGQNPEQALDSGILRERLVAALEGLPPEQRAALEARELEGLSYGEIAERQVCLTGTVKSRIFRARQAMMQQLYEWR